MNTKNSVLTNNLGEALLKSVSTRRKTLLAAILLLGLLLRSYPLFFESFPDPDFYYHLRMARLAHGQGGVPTYDALSYGGRPYAYYPFHHLSVATLSKAIGVPVDLVLPAVTLLIAAGAMLATYLLAKKLFGEKSALLAASAAAVNAGFVARSTAFARPDEYALFLVPLSLLLLLSENNKIIFASLFALFAFFPLIHLPAALVGSFIFMACALAVGFRGSWKKIVAALLGFLAGGAYYFGWNLKELLASKGFASSAELVGLDFSFTLFYSGVFLLFGAIAAKSLLEKKETESPEASGKQKNNLLLAWLAVAFLLQLAANRNVVFFAPALCVAAGLGMKEALEKSGGHKKLLLAAVLAAIATSTAAFLSVEGPGFTHDDVEAAKWLGANSRGALAAAHWDRGHLLTFYGSRVLADGYFEFAPNAGKKVSAIEEMLATPNGARALQLAVENGAEFVFLDEKSIAGLPADSAWKAQSVPGFEKAFENKAQVWRLKEKA